MNNGFQFTPEAVRHRFSNLLRDDDPETLRQQQASEAEAERQRRARMVADFARVIGRRHASCRLENYVATTDQQRTILDRVKRYADNLETEVQAGRGIIFFGSVGVGKDHLSSALAMVAIAKHGLDVAWQSAPDLFADLRGCVGTKSREADILGPLMNATVLVLSDLAPTSGTLSDFLARALLRLVDHRYRAGKPIWVTANLASGHEADQKIGAATVDRLRDQALTLFMSWPSYRRPATT